MKINVALKTFVSFLSTVSSFSTVSTSARRYQPRLLSHSPYNRHYYLKRDTLSSSHSNLLVLPKNARTFLRVTTTLYMGKPRSGSIVDSYQTVSVNCKKCRTRLFRYKKKNGTKSNLIKCYIERISEDCVDLLAAKTTQVVVIDTEQRENDRDPDWICPGCETRFGKDSMIHGRPAIKLVGGKTTMTKK